MAFRNAGRGKFTQVSNAMLLDKQLKNSDKGLLTMMLSFPDDWEYHVEHLVKQSADGRDAVRAQLKRLEEAGYIARIQMRGEKGQFESLDYLVADYPMEKPIVTSTANGFSGDGEGGAGKADTSNTYSLTNTEKQLGGTEQPPLLLVKTEQQTDHKETGTPNAERRQHFAIQASVQKTARKQIEEMVGPQHMWKTGMLLTKYRMKPETLRDRLASQPSLLKRLIDLDNAAFDELVTAAVTRAEKHTSGYQSNVGWQVLNALVNQTKGGNLVPSERFTTAPQPSHEPEFSFSLTPADFPSMGDFLKARQAAYDKEMYGFQESSDKDLPL